MLGLQQRLSKKTIIGKRMRLEDKMTSNLSLTAKETLKEKYRKERQKRLRSDGNEQYLELKDQLAYFLNDPYQDIAERDSVRDDVKFTFIGGGFAGLVVGARLSEVGLNSIRIVEKGGDFGGTWYWNRYPGAQCDTASMVYMPLLEETGHMPTEKYVHGPEILRHCQRIGQQYGLYKNALFHTQVIHVEWLEDKKRWLIKTNRNDEFTSQFLGMGTGPLHVPKLPGIPGIESFGGHSFHTSRWDYAYTGGKPGNGELKNLRNKRVAIIGTGATAVQCVPHLSRSCQQLFVFQRTPSSVDVRNNEAIDPSWFKKISTPGWQQVWLDNFTANQTGAEASDDLVKDGWTEISKRVREKVMNLSKEDRIPEKMWEAYEDADFEKMSEIRARVDSIVSDSETSEGLKAWYGQLCKRPCFHDAYLQSFNNPSTHLIHTDGKGVERITEKGVVFDGDEYSVDCIIFASGFEVGTPLQRRTGFDPKGKSGKRLSDHWADGMRTLHGLQVADFPNSFIVQATQGANLISNYPHNLGDSAKTIASIISHMIKNESRVVEVMTEAEEKWVQLIMSGPGLMLGSQDCTPGYYNNEGIDPGPSRKSFVGYPYGPVAFFDYISEWRNSGTFSGLHFT